MDEKHFDGLAKRVAAGGTRRTALRLLGGSALAAALARLGLSAAVAVTDVATGPTAALVGLCLHWGGAG